MTGFMCFLRLIRGMAGGWWAVEMTCKLFGGFWLGGSDAENWGDHEKKNVFVNSVELSMCESLIETVKHIWVNILYMLDCISSQNCRNSLPLHKAGQLAERSTKS